MEEYYCRLRSATQATCWARAILDAGNMRRAKAMRFAASPTLALCGVRAGIKMRNQVPTIGLYTVQRYTTFPPIAEGEFERAPGAAFVSGTPENLGHAAPKPHRPITASFPLKRQSIT